MENLPFSSISWKRVGKGVFIGLLIYFLALLAVYYFTKGRYYLEQRKIELRFEEIEKEMLKRGVAPPSD